MLRILEYIVLAIGVAIIIVISYWMAIWSYSWLPVQATTDAQRVDNIFSFMVMLSSILFLGIIGMISYSIVTCRAPKGDYREGHPSRGDIRIEALWTITPIVLVLVIAGYSFYIYNSMDLAGPTQILGHLHMPLGGEPAYAETVAADTTNADTNTESAETIEVIAKQWSWTFRYPKENVTSTELHLPVNRRARLLLQSKDVLHGFYVPEFRVKQDIIPDRPIDFQFIPTRLGKYLLKDSEFSGTYFALMQADVYVDSPDNYAQWLKQAASRQPAPASNRAVSEYTQPPKRVFKTNWQTVLPADPPVVNYPT
ncbi:MAG: cytochrome c oxidase subunit II [Scytonema sp. PMC 1069.18]|nr:cytochrome c oxidase subunit II [Scytonema sp. PMC 1069.18]MEC4886654.1 cytochrome c oxidase subunit II [Scytonema sp. PMC 1070.18]